MELYTSSNEEAGLLEELVRLREIEYYTNEELNNYSVPLMEQTLNSSMYGLFGDELSLPHFTSHSSNTKINDSQTFPNYYQLENYYSMSILYDEAAASVSDIGAPSKLEPVPVPVPVPESIVMPTLNMKVKKKQSGQPSKNLMAERRRRKRLNDRLSMLRSLVPKVTKMDRTSILGDTIDYMKEMLERINSLQEEMNLGANEVGGSLSTFKNVKSEEILIRNSPKFEVERRDNSGSETRIMMCCAGKPGLLLSTVTTLEALGMDIQQCVISCFNDFQMQASCSQEMGEMAVLDSEDIKEALFRNAGYGGTCL